MIAARGGSRYGLRPSRLPPRKKQRIREVNEQGKTYTYPQTAALDAAFHPWPMFNRHGWSKFGRPPQVLSAAGWNI